MAAFAVAVSRQSFCLSITPDFSSSIARSLDFQRSFIRFMVYYCLSSNSSRITRSAALTASISVEIISMFGELGIKFGRRRVRRSRSSPPRQTSPAAALARACKAIRFSPIQLLVFHHFFLNRHHCLFLCHGCTSVTASLALAAPRGLGGGCSISGVQSQTIGPVANNRPDRLLPCLGVVFSWPA